MKPYFSVILLFVPLFVLFVPISTRMCGGELGRIQYIGVKSNGQNVLLPFAIKLESVQVSYTPYYLYAVDIRRKKPLPLYNPDKMDISFRKGTLCKWNITVDTLIWSACSQRGKDFARYVNFDFTGGVPAAYLSVNSPDEQTLVQGWVCCGNMLFKQKSLPINEDVSIVFINRQVKRIDSKVRIGISGKLKDSIYHVSPYRINYIRGCYITQIVPNTYEDENTSTSDMKIRMSLLGIIISQLSFLP